MSIQRRLLWSRVWLFILLGAAAVEASIWEVNIDESPAPLPHNGPPFSADATGDRALLPAQICGIVGAYVGSVLIIGFLLLTTGRRLRRASQMAQPSLATEMTKPSRRAFDGSPLTVNSSPRPWYSPNKIKRMYSAQGSIRSGGTATSPGLDSLASFDAKVIEADKAARQQEMERLYAAVMAHNDNVDGVPEESQTTSGLANIGRSRHPNREPLRVVTNAPALRHLQIESKPTSPASPHTPKSPIRTIYPPDSPLPLPTSPISPTSPIRAEYPTLRSSRASPGLPRQEPNAADIRRVSRVSSYGSKSSITGRSNKLRRSENRPQISGPLPKTGAVDDEGGHKPLTPRYYVDPGRPPSPPVKTTTPHSDCDFGDQWREDDDEFEDRPPWDDRRDVPLPAPQRGITNPYHNEAQAITDLKNSMVPQSAVTAADRDTGARGEQLKSIVQRRRQLANASNISIGTLPFRAMQHETNPGLKSPVITKTTYLERRRDMFAANGQRTGVATPYSPYMPFTPLTPVTPHLTSRRERKQREKDEGRRVLAQGDAVIDEKEMWGVP